MAKIIRINEDKLRCIIRNTLNEIVDELNLYHGTRANFDKFDTAYLSTGWGQQAYGYGFYLIDDYDAARDYACGGQVMEVEVPDGKYLTDKSISMREKQKIANIFFKYYTEELDYGKDVYPDAQSKKDFWDYEVSYILNCSTGSYVYGTIASILGGNKETSEFLHDRCGYSGIIIHDKPTHKSKLMKIYVIFSPDDMNILKKIPVNEEIDKYNSGVVASDTHDIGIGQFGIFKLSPALMSCVYEAAFQLLGYERFAIDGEIVLDNSIMDNPWDDAYHILKWGIDNKGLDKKYLGRVSSIYSGMGDDQFYDYVKNIESGKTFWFNKNELNEIFKVLPDKLRNRLVNDMLNVGRSGKVKKMVEYLKAYNGGQNLEEFIQIMRDKFKNGEIKRGGIGNYKEPVKVAMEASRMLK